MRETRGGSSYPTSRSVLSTANGRSLLKSSRLRIIEGDLDIGLNAEIPPNKPFEFARYARRTAIPLRSMAAAQRRRYAA